MDLNIAIFGAGGFIGTNLTKVLSENDNFNITLIDKEITYIENEKNSNLKNLNFIESDFSVNSNFDEILKKQDMVFHLVSSTVPTTSNQYISDELTANVVATSKLLDACVKNGIKRIIFMSSGGTVYGKESKMPISEECNTNPISSYGVQKLTIEKLLYLYHYLHGLDYRVIRLANPYGPFQRPNGVLGAITTFTYKALIKEPITVYGDGNVVRDFIYIDDAIEAIVKIASTDTKHKIFNLGSGKGVSINDVIKNIKEALDIEITVNYIDGRKVDVPINYLDMKRYNECFESIELTSLHAGIQKTSEYLREHYIK